jgi:hypothetical protein
VGITTQSGSDGLTLDTGLVVLHLPECAVKVEDTHTYIIFFQMLKMMIMLENNNEIFEEGSPYELENEYTAQNILQYFLKSNCTTCSSQNQNQKVIKEKDQVCAKVIKKPNKKTAERKATDPNMSEDLNEKVKHCALLVILSCIVYANSLHGDFVHDDISAIVTNQDALGSSSIDSVFYNDFWGMHVRDIRSHKSYRPVTILTFR